MNEVKKMDKNRLTELAGEQRLKEARREPHGANELARRTGISHTTIGEHLKLLDLEPEVQTAVQENYSC